MCSDLIEFETPLASNFSLGLVSSKEDDLDETSFVIEHGPLQ